MIQAEPGAQQPIVAGDLVLTPVSRDLATAIVRGDLSAVVPAEGWPHDDTMDGLPGVANGPAVAWLVTLDGAVIGDCGTHGGPDGAGVIEIGYGLAAPFRGRGYGRVMVAALAQRLLALPGITAVLAHTEPGNAASRRVLELAGFRYEGEEDGESRYLLPVR